MTAGPMERALGSMQGLFPTDRPTPVAAAAMYAGGPSSGMKRKVLSLGRVCHTKNQQDQTEREDDLEEHRLDVLAPGLVDSVRAKVASGPEEHPGEEDEPKIAAAIRHHQIDRGDSRPLDLGAPRRTRGSRQDSEPG